MNIISFMRLFFCRVIMYVDRARHSVVVDKKIPGLVFESFYSSECDNG